MKKVSVHHTGDVAGKDTVVIDEDGNQLDNLKGVTVYLQAGEVAEVTLELARVEVVNTEGKIKTVEAKCPGCDAILQHTCDEQIGGQANDTVTFQIVSMNGSLNLQHNGTMFGTVSTAVAGAIGTITLKPFDPKQ